MNKKGGIETKDKPIFASLKPVFGEQKYPVSAFYIFANVTLSHKGKILLTLSEDRKDRNLWTPPGGEVEVRQGQTPHEAAVAETYQEVGIAIDPRKLILIGEPQIIYPTKEYDPYNGIGIIILSYGYGGEWNPDDIVLNTESEKGCMIENYVLMSFPNSMWEIEQWPYKVYPNYAIKLLEFVKMTREGKI